MSSNPQHTFKKMGAAVPSGKHNARGGEGKEKESHWDSLAASIAPHTMRNLPVSK